MGNTLKATQRLWQLSGRSSGGLSHREAGRRALWQSRARSKGAKVSGEAVELTSESNGGFCDCPDIAVFTWSSTPPSSPGLEASGQMGAKSSSGDQLSELISEFPERVTRGNISSLKCVRPCRTEQEVSWSLHFPEVLVAQFILWCWGRGCCKVHSEDSRGGLQ